MKRLTERDEFGNADIIALPYVMPLHAGLSFSEVNALTDALNRLADYEDTGLEPEEIKHRLKNLKHWSAIWMAEADDRLIILPCKVGDTVYRICHEYKKGNPFIRAVTFNQNNFWRIVFGGEFGKTVFLTRAEAEAALKGGTDG